ncbi:hypothetical protein T01_12107, partial [Trichinella spiralis]
LRQSSSAGARIHVSCGLCRLMKCVTVKTKISIEYQSWHVYKFFIKSSRDRNVPIRSIKVSRVEADIKLRTRKWIAVRNCEDESRILNDPHRITRERKVLVRSIKVSRVEADIKRLRTGKWTAGNALGIA